MSVNNLCTNGDGECFRDHFFGSVIRVIFFLLILYFFQFIAYVRICQLISIMRRMYLGQSIQKINELLTKYIKIASFLTIVQTTLLIIALQQQKKLADDIDYIKCYDSDQSNVCGLKNSNDIFLNEGKILNIVFIIIHVIFTFLTYRVLNMPSTRIGQFHEGDAPIQNNQQQQFNNYLEQINGIAVNQPQQDQNLIQGQDIENNPQYLQDNLRVLKQQQQQPEIKIGQAVLL